MPPLRPTTILPQLWLGHREGSALLVFLAQRTEPQERAFLVLEVLGASVVHMVPKDTAPKAGVPLRSVGGGRCEPGGDPLPILFPSAFASKFLGLAK